MLVCNDKHESILSFSTKFNNQTKAQKHRRHVVVNYAVQPSNLAKNLYSITMI